MIATSTTPQRARWEVLWMSKGRIQSKDCGADFAEAVRIYTLCVKADKKGATLRCANMTFEPTDKCADTEPVFKVSERTGNRLLKDGEPIIIGRKVMEPRQYKVKMGALNRKGVWWCPYCAKLRRFERVEAYEVAGVTVNEPVMMCPLCGISNNDGQVQRYNPYASRDVGRRTRSDKGLSRG